MPGTQGHAESCGRVARAPVCLNQTNASIADLNPVSSTVTCLPDASAFITHELFCISWLPMITITGMFFFLSVFELLVKFGRFVENF